jgi:signal peptidase I
MAIALVVVVVGGLVAGYRPVVLQTGSMADTAPAGSLVIVAPRGAEAIEVGDIVVMRNDGEMPVTHRVIAIEDTAVGPVARTQGDANEFADPAPYALTGDQLVARWIVPGAGAWLERIQEPAVWVALGALVVAVLAARALRRIWHTSPPGATTGSTARVRGERRPIRFGVSVLVIISLATAGLVFGLYTSTAQVPSNQFGASACFSSEVDSIQTGTTVHATNGTITESITAVDPSRAFVTATVRSNSTRIADANAQVVLSGPTTVAVNRATNAGSPPSVTIDWTVVEYRCGITVQRGITTGNGSNQVDVTIGSVDPASSFVLLHALAPGDAASFGPDDLARPLLTTATNLSIAAAPGAVFAPTRTFAWQIISFDDPDDVEVQTVSASLASGAASANITLPTTIDRNSTFITTWVTSSATGPSIGTRLVRATLVDGDTVQVDRSVTGAALDVHVQAVTLASGAVVQHGTIDFTAGVGTRTVDIATVDTTRSSVMSSVAIPGPSAGGRTTHTSSTLVGEASATFVLTTPDTVVATRDATASDASFGWQVVEWSGPTWWDAGYGYRQRIDVVASTADAPGDYTVPFTIDHAALVASGLALANGDDLRVLRWDGAVWTELDRVLDDASSWGTAGTTINFRTVGAIDAGTTSTYWLYLNNPSAVLPPNDPEQVFLVAEDFETGLGAFEDRTGGTGWYTAAPWTRRIPITIPAGRVSTDLVDFALLVSLTDADIGSRAQPDGADVRFTAADGTTPLAHDLERFVAGTGEVVAWVRVPVVTSAVATVIYLYYGAANAPSQADPADVWNIAADGIWHLDRDPSGSAPQIDDVSAANRDGLSLGSMSASDLVAGRIGSGIDFDGADDALAVAPGSVGAGGQLTASAWVRPDTAGTTMTVLSNAVDATNRRFDVTITPTGQARARVVLESGEVVATSGAGTVPVGDWTYLAVRWDGAALQLIVGASVAATTPAAGQMTATSPMPVTIGNVATQNVAFDGVIDEVRLESVARSDAWMVATGQNRSNPTFLTIGATATGTYFGQGTWGARKPITVDSDRVDADVTNFALLVELTDPRIAAGTQSCGCDIVFTEADGTTRLDHVIESYDPLTGALTAWVRVPLLSSTVDIELFIYYSNPAAVDQQDPDDVFGRDTDVQILGVP